MGEAGAASARRQHRPLPTCSTATCCLVPGDAQNKLGLKLIDYDGMWVPALADMQSGEIGHPNFQHPLRLKDRLYNADVDRFPHLVIASALRARCWAGKALWDRFDNGDNLLFKEADLRDLSNAPVVKALWDLNDNVLCILLGKMALASKEPIAQDALARRLLLLTEEGERPQRRRGRESRAVCWA